MIDRLKQYFLSLDQDGSQTISSTELEDPLILFGLCNNRKDVDDLFGCTHVAIQSSTSTALESWSSRSSWRCSGECSPRPERARCASAKSHQSSTRSSKNSLVRLPLRRNLTGHVEQTIKQHIVSAGDVYLPPQEYDKRADEQKPAGERRGQEHTLEVLGTGPQQPLHEPETQDRKISEPRVPASACPPPSADTPPAHAHNF